VEKRGARQNRLIGAAPGPGRILWAGPDFVVR